jgi:ketosteroid isomerase-like protein
MQATTTKTAVATERDLEILTRLNLDYVRSVEQSDVTWFDNNLAQDFWNSNPDGSLVDRQGFLAQIAKRPGISDIEPHDVLVRIMGDFAIIHARTTYRTPAGKSAGRYTDIWARREGRWVCIAAHVTRG